MWEAAVDFVMHGGTNKRASVFSGRKKVFKEITPKQEEYVLAFLDIFFKGVELFLPTDNICTNKK